jgi:hypothetical protein
VRVAPDSTRAHSPFPARNEETPKRRCRPQSPMRLHRGRFPSMPSWLPAGDTPCSTVPARVSTFRKAGALEKPSAQAPRPRRAESSTGLSRRKGRKIAARNSSLSAFCHAIQPSVSASNMPVQIPTRLLRREVFQKMATPKPASPAMPSQRAWRNLGEHLEAEEREQ